MSRQESPEQKTVPSVWHTPRGASPRGLRADAFEGHHHPAPAARNPDIPHSAGSGILPGETRDWAFALPDPILKDNVQPLIDPDANWRHHASLRLPADVIPLPNSVREKFSENWERLAAEAPSEITRRRAQKANFPNRRGWLFYHGRIDAAAAIGPLLLILLLLATFLYGRRLLSENGSTHPANPAAGVKSVPPAPDLLSNTKP